MIINMEHPSRFIRCLRFDITSIIRPHTLQHLAAINKII